MDYYEYQEKIITMIKQMEDQNLYDQSTRFKLVLLGEESVGKTSIKLRYRYEPFAQNIESTKGADYSQKSYYLEKYNKSFGFDVWDTSGQEKYRSLIRLFMKDAQIFILVYDITKRKTFISLNNYWIKEVKKFMTSNSSK